jgi:serine/threonine-protein kinase
MGFAEGDRGHLVGVVLQDSYRLTRLIGQGGMGAVYEGTQLRLKKRIAVKLLARELSSNQDALARFRREAEVTSQLGHPHIVQVFDFGTAPSGEPYLVMEYLEGEDLDQRIRRHGRIPLPAAVSIVRQIASALSSTHSRGIVHRDLKPANVFVLEVEGETDFVKVVDFGISKVWAASVRLTGVSALLGTPNYMSPEQAMGQIDEIDHRTDQWSLGCIAYEMLAGRAPFLGETVHSLLYQVINTEPAPLAALVPTLPAEVARVVHRALSKGQGERFPTVNAFARSLAAAATSESTTSTSAAVAMAATQPAAPAPIRTPEAPLAAPRAQPTTLSRTASELFAPLGRLRMKLGPKGGAALAGGLGVLTLVLVLRPVLSPKTQAPAPEAHPAATSPSPPLVQPIVTAPSRQFSVRLNSDPPGANVYQADGHKLMGATPITVPVDLRGVGSIQLRFEKTGFEVLDQTITDDRPISVSLTPSSRPAQDSPSGALAPPSAPKRTGHTGSRPKVSREPTSPIGSQPPAKSEVKESPAVRPKPHLIEDL